MNGRKYYCIECKVEEIEEPQYCCGGGSIVDGWVCGCMGKPIEPPLCEDCYNKMIERWKKNESKFNKERSN